MKSGELISDPSGIIPIGCKAQFSRRSFKHFIESRLRGGNSRQDICYLVEKAPQVLLSPELNIVNPVQKYKDSSLLGKFFQDSNKAVMIVLDSGGEVRDIISLHFSKRSDFERLVRTYKEQGAILESGGSAYPS